MSETAPAPRPSTPKKTLLLLGGAGAVCLLVGVGYFVISNYLKGKQHDRCVVEAQAAVEAYLKANPPERLGEFQGMSGESYQYPVFGSPGGFYLSAQRTARFAKGTWDVRIVVYPAMQAKGDMPSVKHMSSPDNLFNVEHPGLSP